MATATLPRASVRTRPRPSVRGFTQAQLFAAVKAKLKELTALARAANKAHPRSTAKGGA